MLEINGKVNTAICYAKVIEDEAEDGTKYLIIHSGSRNLGKQVAELYQKLAVDLDRGYGEYFEKRDEIIRTYKEQGRRKEIQAALKELHFEVYEGQPSLPTFVSMSELV